MPPERADARRDLAPIDVGHAEIRDDHVEWLARLHVARERIDARLAAFRGDHLVLVELERIAQTAQQQRIVVDEQDAQASPRHIQDLLFDRHAGGRTREEEAHGRAFAEGAVDLELAAVPLDHAEHHG